MTYTIKILKSEVRHYPEQTTDALAGFFIHLPASDARVVTYELTNDEWLPEVLPVIDEITLGRNDEADEDVLAAIRHKLAWSDREATAELADEAGLT